jgi:hypothetical protein
MACASHANEKGLTMDLEEFDQETVWTDLAYVAKVLAWEVAKATLVLIGIVVICLGVLYAA